MRVWATAFLVCLGTNSVVAGDLPQAVTPDDFPVPGATAVLLGRDLFFDPILSGNQNIACATCHIPDKASADAVALTLGEGASGLGPARRAEDFAQRLGRHTPALFNLGAYEFTALMQDGRVQRDEADRFDVALPEGQFLERHVTSPLAALALVPLVTAEEMAGQPGSNPIADAVAEGRINGLDGAWHLIAQRVETIPEYRQRFDWLIGEEEPLHAVHISQVLADFITYEFRATDSPFDAFLRGDDLALSNEALRGMSLFYGKANCASCHSGPLQTDHEFHAIGVPQIGPGKDHGRSFADQGRAAVTGDPSDAYKFRTPSLRNVMLTAPYGHSGAFADMESMIRHHLDPLTSLAEYSVDQAEMPGLARADEGAMSDFDEVLAISAAIDIAPVALSDSEIAALVSFLGALTDTSFATDRLGPPETVPSGLPVEGVEPPPS